MGTIFDIQNLIQRMNSHLTLTESENYMENQKLNDLEIKEYKKGTHEFQTLIENYYKEIYDFIDNGYKKAGLGEFKGCNDAKSLRKNAIIVKIASCQGVWVAVSIYTNYQGGYKCAGITATTNPEYREIGKRAIEKIVKSDITNHDKFYWCECSGKIEQLYEKLNGIAIPNVYVNEIIKNIIRLEKDSYHYVRLIQNEPFVKIIYGYNTPELFQKVYATHKEYIDKKIEDIRNSNISENAPVRSMIEIGEWKNVIDIIQLFIGFYNKGTYDYPQESLDILNENLMILKHALENSSIPDFLLETSKKVYENGTYVASIFLPLTLNEL